MVRTPKCLSALLAGAAILLRSVTATSEDVPEREGSGPAEEPSRAEQTEPRPAEAPQGAVVPAEAGSHPELLTLEKCL